MSNLSVDKLLPEKLLLEIQQYVQGRTIYIPKPKTCRKKWGECTGIKDEIIKRNDEILSAFLAGGTVYELAEIYSLSTDSIKKIVYRKK